MTIDLVEIVGRFLDGADNRAELAAAHDVLTKGYRLVADYAELPLTKGHWVKVDVADLPLLTQNKWFAIGDGSAATPFTARAKIDGRGVAMARLLLGLTPEDNKVLADHVNFDNLDNRRKNLRPVSKAESVQHRRKWTRSDKPHSQHKGVTFAPKNKTAPWRSVIRYNNIRHHLGYFETEIAAAEAYNAAAAKYHHKYSEINSV